MSAASTLPASRARLWTGRTLGTLVVLFLLFDGVFKFTGAAPVAESSAQLGLPQHLAVPIGALELLLLALYLLPATSVLGATLLTGYLGGATVLHMRVGDPLFSHVLFPIYIGLLLWGALWLREPRVRALLPLRTGRAS